MPEFRQQDKIKDIDSFSSGAVQPVQDNTTAQAIEDISGLAIQGLKTHQRSKGRELASQFEEGVYGQVEVQGEEKAAYQQALREGRKLEGARVSIGEAQFKARAETKLREMMANNPFFSDEIASGFAEVTGFDPRGSGLKAAFALAESQRQLSPEEKALQDYKEAVTNFALRYNTDTTTAERLIENETRLEYEANLATKYVDASKPRQLAYFSATSYQMSSGFLQEVAGVVNEQGGKLTPDQLTLYKNKIQRLGIEFKKRTTEKLAKEGHYVADTSALDNQQEKLVSYLNTILESEDGLSLLQNNIEYVQLEAEGELMMDEGVRGLVAIRRALGSELMGTVLDMYRSDDFLALTLQNENMKKLFGVTQNKTVTRGLASLSKALFGEKMSTEEARAALFAASKSEEVWEQLPEESVDEIMKTVPGALNLYLTKEKESLIRMGDIPLDEVENKIDIVAGAARRKYVMLSGKDALPTGFDFTETVVAPQRGGNVKRRTLKDQDGDTVPSETYTNYLSIYRIANKYPELWKDKYESAEEYTTIKVLGPGAEKKEEPKEKKEPEVSFTPEEERELKISQAMKQYDLDRETVEKVIA